jgi:hypothetical protein
MLEISFQRKKHSFYQRLIKTKEIKTVKVDLLKVIVDILISLMEIRVQWSYASAHLLHSHSLSVFQGP